MDAESENFRTHACVRTGVSFECSCGWHIEGGTDVAKCNAIFDHIYEWVTYEHDKMYAALKEIEAWANETGKRIKVYDMAHHGLYTYTGQAADV